MAAHVLLARSGIAQRPWAFHRLCSRSFFSVERAVLLQGKLTAERLDLLESTLVCQAEADRKIVSALLDPMLHWNKDAFGPQTGCPQALPIDTA